MKKRGYLLCVLLAVLLWGCGSADGNNEAGRKPEADPVRYEENDMQTEALQVSDKKAPEGTPSEIFCTDTYGFTVSLLQQAMEAEEGNVMLSPASVLSALAMTANGAGGETQSQMLSVLADGQTMDDLNENLKVWREGLADTTGGSLKLANGVWISGDEGEAFVKESFLENSRVFFDAQVRQAPFDQDTLTEINEWVREKTDGQIETILGEIPKDAVLYLLNAVSFDAKWKDEYTEYQIRDGIFVNQNGQETTVSMMHSTEIGYIEGEDVTGFVKPYQDGYRFAAFLPKEGTSPGAFVTALDGEKLQALLEGKREETVQAVLPAFQVEYSAELSEILQSMGMQYAFDGSRADFSNLCSEESGPVMISRVIHKTNITVDGLGTKAGAATAVEMARGGMLPEQHQVCLNRPFVYMILENDTNIPVFIGVVNAL